MKADEFWGHVDRSAADGCWPWTAGQNGNGRGRLLFNGRYQYAYRVAWELTNGEPIPADRFACHHCDNPVCCNPNHIFIGTAADNVADAIAKGRFYSGPRPSGLAHGAATVPPEVIRQAVEDYLNGDERQVDVAARYGVSQTALSNWMTAKARRDSELTPRRKPFKPCGTRAAYERHRRNGEKPCETCRLGELEDQRRRRDAKKIGAQAA